jgi:hypothetical protein
MTHPLPSRTGKAGSLPLAATALAERAALQDSRRLISELQWIVERFMAGALNEARAVRRLHAALKGRLQIEAFGAWRLCPVARVYGERIAGCRLVLHRLEEGGVSRLEAIEAIGELITFDHRLAA